MVTERHVELRSLWALALLAAVALVYWPGLAGGFAFDDYHTIVDNVALAGAGSSLSSWCDAAMSGLGTGPLARPLAMLSFAFNYTLNGLDPWRFKLTNLFIHALNAVLVWALVARLATALAPRATAASAWVVAALWALHPVNLTSVLYVVQRMTSLSATFVLLTLLVYTRARQRQLRGEPVARGWPIACAALALLALLSKETALALLFYLVLIEAWVIRAPRAALSQMSRRLLGMAAVAVVAAALWYFLHGVLPGYGGREFTLAERLWSEARVMFMYLRLLLVPTPGAFTLFHDDFVLSRGWLSPPTTALAVLALLALAVLAHARRRSHAALAFGWAWFVLGHLFEGSVVPLELMHEHRNYLPGLGVMLAVTLTLADSATASRWRVPGAFMAMLVLAAVTWSRATLWASPSLLVESELRHHPASPRLWYEAGRLRIADANGDAKRYAAGIAALEQAARLATNKTLPLSALLRTAIERDDEVTIARLLPVIVAEPRESVGEDIFRELVICQGYGRCRHDTASVQRLANAVLARPGLTVDTRQRVLEWLAVFYARVLGDPAAAITILEDLVAARPHSAGLKTRLAEAYASAGQADRAAAVARDVRASLPWSSRFTQRDLRIRLARLAPDSRHD
ncbi:MAG: tetratricopeptide repeat protein [Gammaproteobacteria bacterium]|nr:tetratricopeptide repeat protein [Gammaproteobacteria bacterium]